MLHDINVAPVSDPTAAQYRDAFQKGLGRAVLWAKQGKGPDRDVLLEACLNDLRRDRQVEESRGNWLWEIIETVGAMDDFREAILDALQSIDDGLAAQQLCQFCVHYARRGDERFRARLQAIVADAPVPDCPWLGYRELIELDREAGFRFALRVRAMQFLEDGEEWGDVNLVDSAIKILGEPAAVALLDHEAASAAEVRRVRDHWLSERAERERRARKPKQDHAERMRQMPLHEVIRKAENAQSSPGILRGWGMYASESDLRVILDRLLHSQTPDALLKYLSVFSNRSMPQFDSRVLDLLDHEEERVRYRAYSAIAQNAHPTIREFALSQLQQRSGEPRFVRLFIRNYQPGDEDLLLRTLRVPADPEDCHGLMMDVIAILEQNPGAACRELALRAYRTTPCGGCRFDAAKLLLTRQVAPAWLMEECQWDAMSDTRELV